MQSKPEYALDEADREGATNADPVLDIGHYTGVSAMPVEALISPKGDSATQSNIAPVTPAKWQRIGDLARALVAKAEGRK